jgi:hypothetical protein
MNLGYFSQKHLLAKVTSPFILSLVVKFGQKKKKTLIFELLKFINKGS